MNTQVELEMALRDRLQQLLAGVSGLKDWQVDVDSSRHGRPWDLRASVAVSSGDRVELCVECRDLPRPSQFPHVGWTNEFRRGGKKQTIVPALAAPWISPRMAELCRSHGWSWFDLAGNCRISVPGLYIERTGFDPVHERPKPEANLGTSASARVVRALLAPDNLHRQWTQRDLQQQCEPGVSLGLANKVVRHLREQAYLLDLPGKCGFKLHDPMGLLNEWKEAYRFDRHFRRDFFTLHRPDQLREALANLRSLTGGHAAFAAFSAADLQAPHVRESKTWIYLRRDLEAVFAQHADAKPVESGPNIVVLFPEDDGVFYGQVEEKGALLPCTSPVQTYVDLCHAGGRGEEAAEAVLNQRLKPEWKRAGLTW